MKTDLFKKVQLIIFDFDGVFTDNRVITNQDGSESVSCWRSDGIGLSRISKLGIKLIIVSTETNPVVSIRSAKLNIPCFQAVEDKSIVVKEICKKFGIQKENTMFVGNDINDIPAFKEVGLPVCVADSYPEIYPYVVYKTNTNGGLGAVREICDLIFNSLMQKNSQNGQ
jgi:3-deoxy-D-manno-octulosonate 8-phosphate phosphatase (KDO 8-P phosphatase)